MPKVPAKLGHLAFCQISREFGRKENLVDVCHVAACYAGSSKRHLLVRACEGVDSTTPHPVFRPSDGERHDRQG